MKKRKIIAKLMVLSMIISNVSGINVQANENIYLTNDNIIEYTDKAEAENSRTFEELNVNENVNFDEIVENDDLILNENEIIENVEEIEEVAEEFLETEIEVVSDEINIASPMVSRAAAIGNVNILSSDSTTVAQAEAWARAKGATEEFIGLASLYQKYASSRGGVNWVVAYVQAAKETGYGKFGGVLDASYHNPCGLKESSGGSDTDPNAHKRFDNWDQGVIAHLDHLALYAGSAGYPKTNYVSSWNNGNLDSTSTYDSRHFKYLAGTVTTVNALGGKWAPSKTYGLEIFRLYCDLTGAKYLDARNNLDEPNNNAIITDGMLRVRGWAVHAFGIKEINVSLDGIYLGIANCGVARPDIVNVYPAYFNSAESGYDTTFNISNISNGSKTLEMKIVANDGSYQTVTKTVNVNRAVLETKSFLDSPEENLNVTTDTIRVRGWALDSSGVKSVEAFVDGKSLGNISYGALRPDVNKVCPGYPSGDNAGFDETVNISSLSNGKKTLEVKITGNSGTVQTIKRTISINRKSLEAKSFLDSPEENLNVTTDTIRVRGWALDSSGVKSVEAFVDGKLLGNISYGALRPDVNKVCPGYPSGDNAGFDETVNISSLSNGKKTLEIKITGNSGTVQTIKRTISINRKSLEAKSFLDSPEENLNVTTDTIRVRGWALDSSGVKSVEAFVDGKSLGNISYGALRPDVNKVCPGYPSGDNAGFDETVNISSLSNGKKTLEIKITGNSGTVQTIKRTISINRKSLEAKSFLDSPEENLNVTTDTIRVRGWALDSSGVKSVEAFVDGKSLGNISYGALRPDVNKVCPGYPSGDNAGFDETVNISSLSNGKKTLEVKITGNSGTVQTIKVNFNKVTLESRNFLDEPTVNSSIVGTMTVRGWALSEAGTKEVRIKLDGQLLGKATINVTRNDVYNVHPEYNNKKSGFTATFDISKVSAGTKELIVEIEDNYGNVQIVTRKIKKSNKVVYIDAGHDYGGDRGAVRVINGVTYDETTLNIEVAEYLRTELINRGYEVIMARRMGERPTSSNYRENLWNRINAANNANADFYISIHQNTSTTTSANGVEAYYSSVKPDSLNDITYKLNTSKAVAASISSGIASALSMTNRGAKDDEFMVVKYTNMPAVLVECGFISNENEAKKISDSSNQKKIASVIADSIHNALK